MSNFLYSTINSLGSLYRQSRHSNSQRSSKAAKLPVSSFKDQIMDALEDNTVVIISGTTGSGKSTQVPQFILDHDKSHVKIACTQPRRLAAVSLALRVAHERKDTSRLVGYHISGKNNCSKATKLMYMTTGVLLEQIKSDPKLERYTHIVLDEVHERYVDDDILLSYLKEILKVNKNLKIVIMSATLVPQKYQNYFSEFGSVPFIHIPTKMHEIEIVYVEDICDKFKASHEVKSGVLEAPDRPMLTPSRKNLLADMIMSLHKSLPLNQAILVFLSGLSPILEIADKLTLYENSESMQIHLLHSSITIEEQAQIVRPPAKGKRKVVLSTNVAESSLTIADARIVIDTCLKKDMDFDVSFNGFSLNECWVSKNCAEQRKGRVGRTSPGIVYRLITKNEFEKLRQEQLPEIQRSELSNCVLRCLSIPSHPFFEVLSSCMDPPLNKHINEALKTLISLKAVSFNNGSYSATRLGHILSTVPLNVKNCLLALHGIIFGVGEEAIIAACILQLKSVFIESPVLELETSKAMASFGSSIKREKMEISSDLISNLRAYLFWRENYPENDKEEFYLKYFLSKFFLQEVHDLIILVREGFSKFGLCEPPSDDERASLHKKFKSLMVHSSQVDDFDNFDFMDDFNQQESQQVESFVQKFNEISFNLSNKKIFENGNSIFHINDPGSRVTKGETIKLKKEPNIFTFSIILCASFYSNVLKFDTSENPESCAFPSEFDLTRSVEFGADILPSIPDMLQFLNNKISPVSKYLIINNRIQVEFQDNNRIWDFTLPFDKSKFRPQKNNTLGWRDYDSDESDFEDDDIETFIPSDSIFLSHKLRLTWKAVNTYNRYIPGQIWLPRLSSIRSAYNSASYVPSFHKHSSDSKVFINRISLCYPCIVSDCHKTSFHFIPCKMQAVNQGSRWLAHFVSCLKLDSFLAVNPIHAVLYILYGSDDSFTFTLPYTSENYDVSSLEFCNSSVFSEIKNLKTQIDAFLTGESDALAPHTLDDFTENQTKLDGLIHELLK